MKADAEVRLETLARQLGAVAERQGRLARYSMAGIGGPAELLVTAPDRETLVQAILGARALELPVWVFGGLTNCLICDAGLPGVVVLNHARGYRFEGHSRLHAEAGALVAPMARAALQRGLGGLTWAVGLPGTVGGMVVNNAGAFGGETATVLLSAELLSPAGEIVQVEPAWLEFTYRRSRLKGSQEGWVVLSAVFQLRPAEAAQLQAKAEEYTARRQRAQPPGRTLGSTFKNPPGDYAGRLIEAAGLKGRRVGGVVISPQHANFFVNEGDGTAADYLALICLAQAEVERQFGVRLEPEIEFFGMECHCGG
ncbi:MAG TPA: UDP-N-acetylmuramate dehydrogenase [Anaerolineae bacterium]|nr:UDP-N-acetylmuramate dehydrogenase [Anaerolineae bacterium]